MKFTYAVIGAFLVRCVLSFCYYRHKINRRDFDIMYIGTCILLAGWIIGG